MRLIRVLQDGGEYHTCPLCANLQFYDPVLSEEVQTLKTHVMKYHDYKLMEFQAGYGDHVVTVSIVFIYFFFFLFFVVVCKVAIIN